ncbi:hypothetical protein BS78_05G071600 [Paspalum vaginatum]|nr:hypothetical protein BS78_05G071600 [Paspalum vaginatum]
MDSSPNRHGFVWIVGRSGRVSELCDTSDNLICSSSGMRMAAASLPSDLQLAAAASLCNNQRPRTFSVLLIFLFEFV